MPDARSGDIPLVSVCITTFAQAAYIEACVRSVLAQQLDGDLEVLVGEDASPDGTRDILRALAAEDPRVRLFLRDINRGPTRNLSSLVQSARGRFISHLDGDDAWLPGKLAAQVECLTSDPELSAVYTNARVVSQDGKALGRFNAMLPERIGIAELLRRGNMLCHSSMCYRAEAADAILGLQGPFIDYRLHLRMMRFGTLGYIDRELVQYRWRTPGSMIAALPKAVIDGHLDAFVEAACMGAGDRDLRRAISAFWGKVTVKGLVSGDVRTPTAVGKRLLGLGVANISSTWLVAQIPGGLWRAVRSVVSRSRAGKVFFQ
jgi:glycosyltransferase involved in cell wall biosynthesis